MEVWDTYTKDRIKTGRTVMRGEKLEAEDYHLVVFAFIINQSNEILISRRSAQKTFSGKWEITGGAAVKGDTSEQAILREVKEELGIQVHGEEGKLIKTKLVESYNSYIADIYLFFEDLEMKDIVCQVEEVSEAKFVSIPEFINMIQKNEFTDNTFIYEPIYQVIIEAYFKSWLNQDLNRFQRLLHDEIVVEECTGDMYLGKKTCINWFQKWHKKANKVLAWDITKVIFSEFGKEITVLWTFTCDFDKQRYCFNGCSVFEFKDYLIYSIKEFQMKHDKNYPYIIN